MDIDFSSIYEQEQGFLWGYCYRLFGHALEAEDLVQDTFVRVMERPPQDTGRPWRPWLVREATHLAYDRMRRAKSREYVGPWLPMPVVTEDGNRFGRRLLAEPSFCGHFELHESASIAFLLAIEALTPRQRVVLLLRDAYDYTVREVAEIVELSESNVETVHHQARQALDFYDEERVPLDADRIRRTGEVLRRLLRCLEEKNLAGVEALMADNITALSDGNGRFHAAQVPVEGRSKVVALLCSKICPDDTEPVELRQVVLNFLPSVIIERPQAPGGMAQRSSLTIVLDPDEKIRRVFSILALPKLMAVDAR